MCSHEAATRKKKPWGCNGYYYVMWAVPLSLATNASKGLHILIGLGLTNPSSYPRLASSMHTI